MEKNETWFQSINWDSTCLNCHKANGGMCVSKSCAEMCYDDNGNPIKASSVNYDGDYKEDTK